ncbi:MAG TPA: hypothetical protein PLO59_08695, partial [Bacteroidia bacterium]|nr:hypothetical protein [Bacteroidia bacterium]
GSASGAAYINLHPNPAITSNTFFSNPQSPLSTTDYTISKYKVHLKNGPTITHYRQTRDSMLNITGIAPGMYDLLIYVGDSMTPNSPGFGLDSTLIYTGTLQITDDTLCSLVKGRVFADYNSNCSYEATDLAIPNTIIELNPGGMVGVTDATGNFFIPVTPGSYTLKQYAPAAFKQVCPDTNTFVINIGTGNIVNVPVADTITAQPDVYISCAAGAARPGFSQNIFIRYANNTPHNIGVGQGQFQYDTLQTFVSFTGGTYTTTTGLVSFNLPALSAFGKADFVLVLHTPATAVLGDTLSYMANVPVVLNEVDSLNNSSQQIRIITGSYDPNDITVTPVGFGSAGYVTAYQDLNYQIRFQNTGTDTAFNIVVADTLAMELNRLSVQVLQASHPYRLEIKGRVLQFHFDNILLPDSGTNHIASNGFIVYRIMQAANNAPGTTIKNTAHIYFDFNAPITTNTVTNTIFDCASMASMSINQT